MNVNNSVVVFFFLEVPIVHYYPLPKRSETAAMRDCQRRQSATAVITHNTAAPAINQ